MKLFKNIPFLILAVFFLFSACRTEDEEIIMPPEQQTLTINSSTADLITRTTTNDGSNDNILDNANCLSIQLPVTIIIDGLEIIIDSEDDFDTIEDIFDEFDDDIDELDFIFPITIILSDFTEVTIANEEELLALVEECSGENEVDEDIECIDFQYPITYSIFDQNNELIETVTISNDQEHYEFIENLDDTDIITINFPLTLILSDGNTVTVTNILDLEEVIEDAIDDCDEDDDNDFDDDDCEDCTTDQLTSILTDCAEWEIDKLERNDNDLEDSYDNIVFSFSEDGTISIDDNGVISNGMWNAMSNDMTDIIEVTIDVAGDTNVSGIWILHEIEEETGEVKVDLRIGDDRLRFESDCTNDGGGDVDDTVLVNALTTGDWYVTLFFDDVDETSDFADYVFNFASDNTATATDNTGTTDGNWTTSIGDETDLELNLNFGTEIPLDELAEDWDVIEVTNEIIRLRDISGDGTEDLLTFERNPSGGGNGNEDVEVILSDGLWIVASYTEDNDDQTNIYNGYEIDFNSNGTVMASNGANTNNGTWMVFNNGNQMSLNFGTDAPFNEFNDDDWDVISVSSTEVTLQDVSGGNGGIDTLTFQKL